MCKTQLELCLSMLHACPCIIAPIAATSLASSHGLLGPPASKDLFLYMVLFSENRDLSLFDFGASHFYDRFIPVAQLFSRAVSIHAHDYKRNRSMILTTVKLKRWGEIRRKRWVRPITIPVERPNRFKLVVVPHTSLAQCQSREVRLEQSVPWPKITAHSWIEN